MPTSLSRILGAALAAAALGLAGCGEVEEATSSAPAAAKLEPIQGSAFKRVVLVPKAVERLDIKTVEVRSATNQEMEGVTPAGQPARTAIPYDAVLYDKTGAAFAYTNPKENEYVRQAVVLDGVKNRVAVMAAGPPAGTKVVTVGGIELYGLETGVGK